MENKWFPWRNFRSMSYISYASICNSLLFINKLIERNSFLEKFHNFLPHILIQTFNFFAVQLNLFVDLFQVNLSNFFNKRIPYFSFVYWWLIGIHLTEFLILNIDIVIILFLCIDNLINDFAG